MSNILIRIALRDKSKHVDHDKIAVTLACDLWALCRGEGEILCENVKCNVSVALGVERVHLRSVCVFLEKFVTM